MTNQLEKWDAARLAELRKFGVRLGLRSDMIGLDSKIVEEAADEIERQAEEIARLREKTSCFMGVGDGSGQQFVYGDYESIKEAQRIVLRMEKLSAEIARLKAALRDAINRPKGVVPTSAEEFLPESDLG